MFWVFLLLSSVFVLGLQTGVLVTLRSCTKKLKEANDLLELQNKTIAEYKQRDDGGDWWKPEGWKAEWEPGDA